jgi:hypothetical protein
MVPDQRCAARRYTCDALDRGHSIPTSLPRNGGVRTFDDVSGAGYWQVFGGRYSPHHYFDQHIRGWVYLPLPCDRPA